MKIKNALATFQFHKKETTPRQLSTPFGHSLDPKHIWDEYPRPQLKRKEWVNLNGYWDYAFTASNQRPLKFDGKILVPFSPESQLSGVGRQLTPKEFLWYHRTFSLSQLPRNQRLLLHFGAVDQDCTIFLNGKQIGSHQGGYLPFSIEITGYSRIGSNTLWIKVQDESDMSCKSRGKQKLKASGMFYTAQSGIWQTVWMEWVPRNYIRSIKITPDLDQESVLLDMYTTNPVPKVITIYEGGRRLCSVTTARQSCRIPLEKPHPWTPEYPFLYRFTVNAGEDEVSSYFAMRKFSTGTDESGIPRLFLNNQPYFQNGVLDQGYWSDGLYTAPSDEAFIFDIATMKNLGFNMIRKHLKIEPLRWYYHCDRMGMIVWQDMVNGGGRSFMTFLCYLPTALPFVTTRFKDHFYPLFSRSSKNGRKQWLKECRETIELLYNSPCIALWTAFNEGWGQFDARKVADKIRLWDPTRLIDHASGWYDQGCGDIRSVHNYFRPLKVVTEDRPFVISEYGGYTCQIPEHSYSENSYGYRSCHSMEELSGNFQYIQAYVRQLEKEGLAAAVYTQLSDVEEEVNGLLTYDRRVKKV